MINTLKTSILLNQAYRTNALIYRLKSLPLIGKRIPDSLYGSDSIKILGSVYYCFTSVINVLINKAIYLGVMAFLPFLFMEADNPLSFSTMLLMLTLAGVLFHVPSLSATKEQYYAVMLMRVHAQRYALSTFIWSLLTGELGLLAITCIYGIFFCHISFWLCLSYVLLHAAAKIIGLHLSLWYFGKYNVLLSEAHRKTIWGSALGLTVTGYLLTLFRLTVPTPVMYIITAIFVVAAVFCFPKIWHNTNYYRIYKRILAPDTLLARPDTAGKVQQTAAAKQIEAHDQTLSNRDGYAYFHELFIMRHRKALMKTPRRQALALVVIFIALLAFLPFSADYKASTNNSLMTVLPYTVFIMYLLNRGGQITQIMFMNCDHSMLAYRFYRQPKTILGLFKVRLLTLIRINLLPAAVIAIGLPLLLWLSGGTDNPLNYLLLFISIMSMAVFFSVHHLTLYYLLQPYNIDLESKSGAFSLANWLTYLFSYIFINVKAPTTIFTALTTLFCAIYIAVALVLVYRMAPRTFRLK